MQEELCVMFQHVCKSFAKPCCPSVYCIQTHTPTHALTYRDTCLWWSFCRMSFVRPKCIVAYKAKYIRTIKFILRLSSDMCFWSDYHNVVISLTAFNLARISIQFHVWIQKHIVFEDHQRRRANDKQRPSVAYSIIWDLNPPDKPHPENSLSQQMYTPDWTSCQKSSWHK